MVDNVRMTSEIPGPDPRLAHALALCAQSAAVTVAPYLRSVARTVRTFDTKADVHDPVTVHDKLVEGALQQLLCLFVPGSRVLGEERGEVILPLKNPPSAEFLRSFSVPTDPQTIDAARRVMKLGQRVRWIVDPIDGTANFAAGGTYFNTSVAAELDGKVVAGAICVPMLREVFAADSERAWWSTENGSETRELRANGPRREEDAVIVSYYPGLGAWTRHPEQALDHEIRLAKAYQTIRKPGAAALDLARVAAGWLGVFMAARLKPWDVAAGIHLVRVAGGSVVNVDLGTGEPDGLRPAVVASGANLDAVTAKQVLAELEESYLQDHPQ